MGMFDVPEYMTGLLGEQGVVQAKDSAMNMGLLGALGQLLQAAGPNRVPVSTGQAIGSALIGGVQGYQGAMDKAVQDKMNGLKVGQMVQDANEKAAMYKLLQDPAARGQDGSFSPDLLRQLSIVAPTASKPLFESMKAYKDSQNKVTGQPFAGTDSNGNAIQLQQFDDGTVRTLPGYGPARKMVQQDNGGTITWVDENSVKPGTTTSKTLTPGERASNALGWANYNKPQFSEGAGGWVGIPSKANPQGTYVPVEMQGKPLTEDQGKSSGFLMRMRDASKILNDPQYAGDAGDKPELIPSALRTAGLDASANTAESAPRQQYRQAQENWVSANLRAESGAAIGIEEMNKEVKKYFPQIGDSDAVVKQKAKARQVAESAMELRSGAGAKKVPASTPPNMDDLAGQAARILANRVRNGG